MAWHGTCPPLCLFVLNEVVRPVAGDSQKAKKTNKHLGVSTMTISCKATSPSFPVLTCLITCFPNGSRDPSKY